VAGSPPDGADPVAPDPFFDRTRLRRLRALVEACRADPRPHLRLLPDGAQPPRSLAVLAGSFNPLTVAHTALAEAAERAGLGTVGFALSTHTVDKERIEGAQLEDRLLVLELHAATRPGRLVALLNRGLYVEQAGLIRASVPDLERLSFLVGFDKIVQIFNPRYYDDRDAALERLFGLAELAVAPRAEAGPEELTELLARPENRRFAAWVRPLDVPAQVADVASSTIRRALAEGRALPEGLTPESTAFIQATGCYGSEERYARRAARIAAC
jgi:nicotinic acid mononucleotide adenylyltransferase